MNFASPQVQKTTGTRGKTTRRKATKTVRGNDGAYVAAVKEELLARAPWQAFQVTSVVTYCNGFTTRCPLFRCKTREEAVSRLAEWVSHPFTRPRDDADKTTAFEITEVTVRWAWFGSEVKEEVVS